MWPFDHEKAGNNLDGEALYFYARAWGVYIQFRVISLRASVVPSLTRHRYVPVWCTASAGLIPKELGNLTSLRKLNLRNNNLQGEMSCIVPSPRVRKLRLYEHDRQLSVSDGQQSYHFFQCKDLLLRERPHFPANPLPTPMCGYTLRCFLQSKVCLRVWF